jgi:hypothetical protein
MDMKNLFVYHLIVTAPLVFIIYPWAEKDISTAVFLILSFTYAFVFRPIMDYYRLKAMGKIEERDFWKMWKWGGFYRFRYYSTLMFGK